MHISYSVSLWNYTHYADTASLERNLALLREQGYGVELWSMWHNEQDLFGPAGRQRLRAALEGMPVTLHTAGVTTIDEHCRQIDAAADLGARLVVLHPSDVRRVDADRPDGELIAQAVEYATTRGVRLALENGQLRFIAKALEAVPGLGACLDVGHVYLDGESMPSFLAAIKSRLIHLHLQDILDPAEAGLPDVGKDHYTPGTGGIPRPDWELLASTLREIDYDGVAVFEIRPRTVLQTALSGMSFMQALLG